MSIALPQSQYKMQCGLLLNVVITQSSVVLKLLACKDETLLIGRAMSAA